MLFTALFPTISFAQQGKIKISLEGVEYDNFARVIFRVNDVKEFSVISEGDELLIGFGREVDVNFGKLLVTLKMHIRSAAISGDRKNIILKLRNNKEKIRKFVGNNFVGVDIVTSIATDLGEKIENKPIVQDIKKENIQANEQNIITAPKEQKTKNTTAQAAEKKQKKPLLIKKEKEIPVEKSEEKIIIKEKVVDGLIDIKRENIENGFKILFPWKEKVASVIFARDRHIWFVFDKSYKLMANRLRGIDYIDKIKQIPHDKYSILRISLVNEYMTGDYSSKEIEEKNTEHTYLNLLSYKDKDSWVVEISERKSSEGLRSDAIVANQLDVFSKKLKKKGGAVFIPVINATSSLSIIDPTVGDSLVLIPLVDESLGIGPKRDYVDFSLHNTAQGIVIGKKSDQLKYKIKQNGVYIYGKEKLNISEGLLQKIDKNTGHLSAKSSRTKKIILSTQTIFPFKYVIEDKGLFTEVRQKQYLDITKAANEEKAAKRYRIAKTYFVNGMYHEALGVLREIKMLDPLFKEMQVVDLTMAAIDYILGRYSEAEEKFLTLLDNMKGQDSEVEIKFWRWASHFQKNKGERASTIDKIPLNYIDSYSEFMLEYPVELRYSFGLITIENKLMLGDVNVADNIYKEITVDDPPDKYANDIEYFKGKILEAKGEINEAEKVWTQLITKSDDRYNRARASFALTKMNLLHAKITIDEAVEVFNQLGVVWRGDSFELELLKLIGQLYVREGKYAKGLRSWQTLVSNFPNSKEAIFIAGKMKRAFINLFDRGKAYEMPPLEALSLYFEFSELTPVGERGDRIIQQLVEHFIDVDLLDNAAALIEHQVKYRVLGWKKDELSIKLAELFLDNRKYRKAIEAVGYIDQETASNKSKMKGKYLEAEAYLGLKNIKKIRDILEGDFSKEAQNIRLQIFWKERNWFGVINIIEPRLTLMKIDAPLMLTDTQVNDIIKLSVAYGSQEERQKLRDLKKDFNHRIASEKSKNIFSFITNDIAEVDYMKFEKTVQLHEIEGFMADYAFWPTKDWKNTVKNLLPRSESFLVDNKLDNKEKVDVVRLAIAYSMMILAGDKDAGKGLVKLQRDFKTVSVNRSNIDIFAILDDRFIAKEQDAIFEGNVLLKDLPTFIEQYQAANKISELNAALRIN